MKNKQAWLDKTRRFRVAIEVEAAGFERFDKPVEVEMDFSALLKACDPEAVFDHRSIRVVERTGNGEAVANVIFQFDPYADENGQRNTRGRGILLFLMKGRTDACSTRYFEVYFDVLGGNFDELLFKPMMDVMDGIEYEGQPSFKVTTPNTVWYYHKTGSGFASMIDVDGNDWISYHPYGGSDGKYRGIPNLVHPESQFHPGPGKEGDSSRILSRGPLCVRILSETGDKSWACVWDIYPNFSRLTVKKAPRPFWFLYEGTPAGCLNESTNYYVLSDGRKARGSETFTQSLPLPKWIYFGDQSCKRVLYLVNHQKDSVIDSYWPMEKSMTVFGFGRERLNKYLETIPAYFTVGFSENTDFSAVSKDIHSSYQPLVVRVGETECFLEA